MNPLTLRMTLVILLTLRVAHAASAADTPPEISLVMIGYGDVCWTRFGHEGLLLGDPDDNRSLLYDFGHTKKNTSLPTQFLLGDCWFHLKRSTLAQAFKTYRKHNRSVSIQPLHLTSDEKRVMVERLKENIRPENRDYHYDYLFNNCSTQVRDLLDAVTGGALRTAVGSALVGRSYREYTLAHTSGHTLLQIGLDLIGGPHHDREVDAWTNLYLPVHLSQAAQQTLRVGIPLAGEPQTILERRGPPALRGKPLFGRWMVGMVSILLASLIVILPPKPLAERLAGGGTILVGLLMGLIGTILALLVWRSDVPDFMWNHNVLVFAFSDLLLIVPGTRMLVTGSAARRGWLQTYLVIRLSMLGAYALLKTTGLIAYQDNAIFILAAAALLSSLLIRSRGPWGEGRMRATT